MTAVHGGSKTFVRRVHTWGKVRKMYAILYQNHTHGTNDSDLRTYARTEYGSEDAIWMISRISRPSGPKRRRRPSLRARLAARLRAAPRGSSPAREADPVIDL
jgi:hypothetical protein